MNKPAHLIINNPYAAPSRYSKYDRDRDSFELAQGRRNLRPRGTLAVAQASSPCFRRATDSTGSSG